MQFIFFSIFTPIFHDDTLNSAHSESICAETKHIIQLFLLISLNLHYALLEFGLRSQLLTPLQVFRIGNLG